MYTEGRTAIWVDYLQGRKNFGFNKNIYRICAVELYQHLYVSVSYIKSYRQIANIWGGTDGIAI